MEIHKGSRIQSDCLIRYERSPLSSSDRERRELLPANQHNYGGLVGLELISLLACIPFFV